MRLRLAVVALILGACAGPAAADADTPPSAPLPPLIQQGEAFHMTFDTPALDAWRVSDRDPSGAWMNCALSREQVIAGGGRVTLGLEAVPYRGAPLSCGEIQSRARYGHGTYEARMRTTAKSGTIGAFFTYVGPVNGKPHDEIDVELLGRYPQQVSPNSYVDGKEAKLKRFELDGEISDFHTYTFVWERDAITWYVDGQKMAETRDPAHLPKTAQMIFFSIWSTDQLTDWMGELGEISERLTVDVDWVAFTPLGEACHYAQDAEGSYLCR